MSPSDHAQDGGPSHPHGRAAGALDSGRARRDRARDSAARGLPSGSCVRTPVDLACAARGRHTEPEPARSACKVRARPSVFMSVSGAGVTHFAEGIAWL